MSFPVGSRSFGDPAPSRDPTDGHQWLTDYLRSRSLLVRTRSMMAMMTAGLSVAAVALLLSPDGPRDRAGIAMMATTVFGGTAGTMLWVVRWPSARQSLAYGATVMGSVALACLAQPVAFAALMGCIAFAVVGAFFAFWHTRWWVVLNVAVATAVGTVGTVRLTSAGHTAVAWVALALVVQIVVAMPLSISFLLGRLRVDLLRADRDPLTGLLNRRGFYDRVLLLNDQIDRETEWTVMLLDLDKFKNINDSLGHSAGDGVLVSVAQALQTTVPPSTAVARSGGEEFLIALAAPANADAAVALAAGLCRAIRRVRPQVTASVGLAGPSSMQVGRLTLTAIDEMIALADVAMYCAKRAGGDQICRAGAHDAPCRHHIPDGS